MGSTQQGQAVVEMVLVGGFKKLKRHTHTHTELSEKNSAFPSHSSSSVNQTFSGKAFYY